MPADLYDWDIVSKPEEPVKNIQTHIPDFATRAIAAAKQRRANAVSRNNIDIELTPTRVNYKTTHQPTIERHSHGKTQSHEYFDNSPPWYVNALMGLAVAKETINTARTLDRGYELVSMRDTRLPF